MAGLTTISRGIGYGPLSTITRGYLGGLEFAPGIALEVLASPSIALVVAAASVLLVQGQTCALGVLAEGSSGTLEPAPTATAVIPAPSAIA